MSAKTLIARTLLDGLYYTNAYRLLEDKYKGVGVILTLHHVVKAENSSPFNINRLLEITPEFLEQTIQQVIALGYDIVSLDEMRQRLINQQFSRRFICFTLDDGYIDNYQYAFPIFKKYNIPFTIYVTTGITEGTAILWWRCLEKIILQENQIDLEMNGRNECFESKSLSQKKIVFDKLYWYLRNMPLKQQHTVILALATKYRLSVEELCLNCAMSWDMLKEISQNPLATIGTHTANHLALAKLPVEDVKNEVTVCRDKLSQHLQIDADHFCYPYGDGSSADTREFKIIEDLGFKTATTTRKQVIRADHNNHLFALPRIPLNGHYQQQRYVQLLLSGVPTGLWESAKQFIKR
ncbi:polysaccharide deacetylase family protein [Crenothrix sp.]|uniref:polysaccharide deacetylase family protein n=1 Tax=Crenothrix sp. TaxID=3100433 RepID=UPI00374DD3A5